MAGRMLGSGHIKLNDMELLSIFCKCGKTVESSSGDGGEGLLIVFSSMIVCGLLFYIWLKTPAGKHEFGDE